MVHEERYSPEFQEAALLDGGGDLIHDLVVRARYERERAALEALVTPPWARSLPGLG